jgi:NAD(P)-dependent dehydrogenase (short-subunit alcohol dehydrogenase family)
MEEDGAHVRPTKIYADKYTGQTVIVTGSARGIGLVTAILFADQGANVVLLDLDESQLKKTQEELVATGKKVTYRVVNLALEDQVTGTINEIAASLGIDVCIHVAGIYPFSPILEQSTEEYQRIMRINVDSTFFLTRAVLPHMQKVGYGRIINTASGTAVQPEAGLATYAASKSAVIALTRAVAAEAGPGEYSAHDFQLQQRRHWLKC